MVISARVSVHARERRQEKKERGEGGREGVGREGGEGGRERESCNGHSYQLVLDI